MFQTFLFLLLDKNFDIIPEFDLNLNLDHDKSLVLEPVLVLVLNLLLAFYFMKQTFSVPIFSEINLFLKFSNSNYFSRQQANGLR